mmetsp:Transcript_8964/g.13332  ORF Transcript_8964/g.13332 Transcript_8964/m.13332 type:complete len:89 (+) Transcript_8964:894-1160(+)
MVLDPGSDGCNDFGNAENFELGIIDVVEVAFFFSIGMEVCNIDGLSDGYTLKMFCHSEIDRIVRGKEWHLLDSDDAVRYYVGFSFRVA